MSRCAYVNGRYVPHATARAHVEDRGMQFSDGVYEVIAVVGGELVDAALHFERLDQGPDRDRLSQEGAARALDDLQRFMSSAAAHEHESLSQGWSVVGDPEEQPDSAHPIHRHVHVSQSETVSLD